MTDLIFFLILKFYFIKLALENPDFFLFIILGVEKVTKMTFFRLGLSSS